MKLLILTQRVDYNDALCGFFHNWIIEFSKKYEKVIVICLEKGAYELPENVEILSLGKEDIKKSNNRLYKRFYYIKKFYKHVFRRKKDYDDVFVHMNNEYVYLGALFWRAWGKKVILWYAHYLVNLQLRGAVAMCHRVVTSTKFACNIVSSKLKIVGQGTDTEYFRKKSEKKEGFKILFLGRISRVKDLGTLVEAFALLKSKYGDITLDVVGAPTEVDNEYYSEVMDLVSRVGLGDDINFVGQIGNRETLKYYNEAHVYVNLTKTGSFDKTTLEAMSCETPVLVCNKAFESIFTDEYIKNYIFVEADKSDLQEKLERLYLKTLGEREKLGHDMRQVIIKEHGLKNLVNNIFNVFRRIE